MATGRVSGVIQHLRRAMLRREAAGLTDGRLLADYLSRHDEAALEALVYRHGPMVWGVCRRVLGNYHDAEDAFQATFLVLVRRAASIASPELLANWLYGVAHQTALKARATVARRKVRERQATEMPEPAAVEPDLWNDLRPLLDQELSRLPDIYRVIIVLCDLEGKTRKEAAGRLGLPEGTVASRLARARVLLAKRLAQRGVALSGGALAAVLAQNVASAGVPDSVASSTISAASCFAAGQVAAAGLVSVKVAALAEGVLKAMMLSKLKAVMAVVLVLGFLVTGAIVLSCRAAAPIGKPPVAEERQARADGADALALPAGAIARLGSPRLRHGARLKDIAYSPNGKRIASVGYDNALRAWDAESGQPLFAVNRPDGGFDKVSFAAEGSVIAALGRDADQRGVLWRIEAATGKVLDRLKVDATMPKWTMPEAAAVRFSSDGSRLALGSADKKQLLVFDTGSAAVIWTADLGKEVPGGVAFAPDGNTVAVATRAGRVHLFDRDGKPTEQYKAEGTAELSLVALSPDGKLVTARSSGGSPFGELITWERATGRILWTQKDKGGHGIAFTTDSTTIVDCGSSSFASTIDAADGKTPGDKKDASFDRMAEIRCLALHPGGKVVAFGSDSGTICLFDVATRKPVPPTAEPSRFVERLRFSADGKTLYGWALDWLAWDVATGKQRYVTNAGGWNFRTPLSPDGKYTARVLSRLGALGGTLFEVCDAATGEAVYTFPGRDFKAVWFDFTPDGKAIIAFEADGSIQTWSLAGERLVRMSGHKGAPVYRAFAASAPVMVTATNLDPPEEFSVRVWDLKDGKELGKFNPGVGLNKGNGYSYGSLVALSGDGKRVAALTYSNSYGKPEPKERATVWDVESGKVLARVPQGGDSGYIALSPDGRLVAVAALWKNDVWVYEVDGGGERFHFRHGGEVTGLAFAPDGRTLAAASKEAPVYLWDVSGKKR